jgi:hypothetical protein
MRGRGQYQAPETRSSRYWACTRRGVRCCPGAQGGWRKPAALPRDQDAPGPASQPGRREVNRQQFRARCHRGRNSLPPVPGRNFQARRRRVPVTGIADDDQLIAELQTDICAGHHFDTFSHNPVATCTSDSPARFKREAVTSVSQAGNCVDPKTRRDSRSRQEG